MMSATSRSMSRSRSVAFVALSVALMAVSAWISVPLGPVPFTLQTFVAIFVLVCLPPAQAVATMACYVLMGTVGLPVFSGMRGGLGVIMGPTGGYLWGYLVAALAVWAVRAGAHTGNRGQSVQHDVAVAAILLVVSYACGWLQLMLVTGMGPAAAAAAGVAPFVIVDVVKAAVAVATARAVRRAVGSVRGTAKQS